MDVQRFFAVRDTYSHAKLAAVLGATVVYVAAVLMMRPIVGGSVLIAVTVPALLAAWSFGARAGLLAVLLGFLLNLLLVTAFVEEGLAWWLVRGGALGGVTLAGVALAVGHLRDVRARLESELLERRRLQGVVWRSDERLAAALGSMVDAVLTIDRRGRFTDLNPAAGHRFGHPRSRASPMAVPLGRPANCNRVGMPTVLLETMARGTPCTATAVTGIPEIVRDDQTGLITPQHDPASLADAIERLLDDEALGERLATNARQLVEQEFDIHRNTVTMRALFRTGMPSRAPVTLEVG